MASQAAANTPQSSCALTDSLPQEIRDEIYEYVLVFGVNLARPFWAHSHPRHEICKDAKATEPFKPLWFYSDGPQASEKRTRNVVLSASRVMPFNLLLVSRRINMEASRIFYGKNQFTLRPINLMTRCTASPTVSHDKLSLMTTIKLILPLESLELLKKRHPSMTLL